MTRILKESSLVKSTSEAMRLINQGAVRIDEKKVEDTNMSLEKNSKFLIQVGKKKIAKIPKKKKIVGTSTFFSTPITDSSTLFS